MIVDPFFDMHERIKHNAQESVAGAAVIVFPNPTGTTLIEPIELLILDPKADVAQFIATLSTRLKMIAEELDARQRQGFR